MRSKLACKQKRYDKLKPSRAILKARAENTPRESSAVWLGCVTELERDRMRDVTRRHSPIKPLRYRNDVGDRGRHLDERC